MMREQMKAHGFCVPTFQSDRGANTFVSRFLLHHFLSEFDLEWLEQVAAPDLSDSMRLALIFVREQGAIDNRALRQLTDRDMLAASADLRRLAGEMLLTKKGRGAGTFYVAGPEFPAETRNTLAAALKREHLKEMVESKELELTHPEMEKHPKQAYRAKPKS